MFISSLYKKERKPNLRNEEVHRGAMYTYMLVNLILFSALNEEHYNYRPVVSVYNMV